MSTPRVVTEPLGGAALAAAAIAGRAPSAWYPPRPSGPDAWRARAAETTRSTVGWLERLRPAFGDSPPARLERAAAQGGAVVTTGQQPGLFGGPIYTWSKALSALALADALDSATGVPTAPVFWAATDDADFAEASVTFVAVPGGVDELRMSGPATDGIPMARVPLGDVRPLLQRLERGAGSAAYGEALDALRHAYGDPAATVGGAYLALLRAVLEPLGIAVIDASHPAVREAGAPVLRAALRRSDAVAAALSAREREMSAVGLAPQVASVPGLALVFEEAPGGSKERVRLARAAEVAERAPSAALSPNVLLRPVMERAILPTVAYVAGPGEIAYFAQVSAVASAVGAPQPLAVPRWSASIIEPHVERLLARLGLDAAALRDPHAADSRVARAAMPQALHAALAAAHDATEQAVARIRAAGDGAVPDPALDGAARSLGTRLDRLERRYVAAFKRRESERLRDVATARGALWPFGKRQERVLNFLPLLARHGPGLVEQMRACASEAMGALVGRENGG